MNVYRRDGTAVYWMEHRAGGKRHRRSTGSEDEKKARKIGREWARRLDERYSVERVEITLSVAIESFLEHCARNRLAKQTLRGYSARLKMFMVHAGDEDLSTWWPDDAYKKVADYLGFREAEVKSTTNDRVPICTFFNYLRARRWYIGENPGGAKLHLKRKPRRKLKETKRRTTLEEELILRREGAKMRIWPVLLLTRWAGMRRGEACLLRWGEINLDDGYADVSGHEGGRKHPRRVWLAEWVVDELRALRPTWLPEDGNWPVWPGHQDTATAEFREFCTKYLSRRITFNDLRASFSTDCFEHGLTPKQESKIVGHSASVAERHYEEYEAHDARSLLPGDPIQKTGDGGEGCGKRIALRIAT